MSQDITKLNAELTEKVKAQDERIHALEIENLVDKIHSKAPKFDPKGHNKDVLTGILLGLSLVEQPKAHAVAETTPAGVIKQRKIGECIDEDAQPQTPPSDP